jgi:hypothetical protein
LLLAEQVNVEQDGMMVEDGDAEDVDEDVDEDLEEIVEVLNVVAEELL